MRLIARILKILVALFIAVLLGSHFFLSIRGRELFVKRLSEVFNRPVTVGQFSTSLLCTIHIRDLEIPGIFKADRLYLTIVPYDMFKRSFGFNYVVIDGAEMYAERKGDSSIAESFVPVQIEVKQEQPPQPAPVQEQPQPLPLSPEPQPQPPPEASAAESATVQPSPEPSAAQPPSVPPAQPEAPTAQPTVEPVVPSQSAPAAAESTPPPAVNPPAEPPRTVPTITLPRLFINHLLFRNSSLVFTDKEISAEGLVISVRKLYVAIHNLNFAPRGSRISEFKVTALLPWREGEEVGRLSAAGWLDPLKKNIQARVDITAIDAIRLYPYYAPFVNLEKTRIQSAKLNFSSDINGLDNEVTAQCHLELLDIVFRTRAADEVEKRGEKVAAIVFDIFRSLNKGKVAIDFTIKTRLDRPEFGLDSIKAAIDNTIAEGTKGKGVTTDDVVLFPAKVLTGTIKGTADVTKAILGGAVSVGAEFARAIGAAFKRDVTVERKDQ